MCYCYVQRGRGEKKQKEVTLHFNACNWMHFMKTGCSLNYNLILSAAKVILKRQLSQSEHAVSIVETTTIKKVLIRIKIAVTLVKHCTLAAWTCYPICPVQRASHVTKLVPMSGVECCHKVINCARWACMIWHDTSASSLRGRVFTKWALQYVQDVQTSCMS